jgi:hypothetical protein
MPVKRNGDGSKKKEHDQINGIRAKQSFIMKKEQSKSREHYQGDDHMRIKCGFG